jgi:hypothetical protein
MMQIFRIKVQISKDKISNGQNIHGQNIQIYRFFQKLVSNYLIDLLVAIISQNKGKYLNSMLFANFNKYFFLLEEYFS